MCESVCANVVQNGLFHKKILRPDAVKHNLDPVNLFPSLSAVRNKFEFIFGFVPAIQSVKRLLSQRQWRRTQVGQLVINDQLELTSIVIPKVRAGMSKLCWWGKGVKEAQQDPRRR